MITLIGGGVVWLITVYTIEKKEYIKELEIKLTESESFKELTTEQIKQTITLLYEMDSLQEDVILKQNETIKNFSKWINNSNEKYTRLSVSNKKIQDDSLLNKINKLKEDQEVTINKGMELSNEYDEVSLKYDSYNKKLHPQQADRTSMKESLSIFKEKQNRFIKAQSDTIATQREAFENLIKYNKELEVLTNIQPKKTVHK
jgi:hypothetical protein